MTLTYENSLPGTRDSVAGAQEWIRSIARRHHPTLQRLAPGVIADMMAIAIRHTPPGGTIHLTATHSKIGLTVEIRDSGQQHPPDGGFTEWASISTVAWSARSSNTADGHLTQVELHAQNKQPA